MDVKEFAALGGKARAKSMTKAERVAAATKAINARWDRVRAKKKGRLK